MIAHCSSIGIPICLEANFAWLTRATWKNRHGWEPWCWFSTVMSHSDRSMAAGSRGASTHNYENRVGVGLGQVVCSKRNRTTRSVMFGYW
ncbi:hypothetical protein DVH24_029786 [Malus domestica]|uniref:Uncharacterized protein n=1 Tax=Malus domestica TaxID=3750 RepID=A0A498HZL6_MALDO|nr:hypothetical protein DVH24_029786 [Malus domestica]